MESLSVNLENCYGISKFDETFTFKKANANLIYAPNGVMKTSFAKTFLALSKGVEPEERMFNKKPKYDIRIDGVELKKDNVLVIKPFDKDYEASNLSTLLVNSDKKTEYDKIIKDILDAKKSLIAKLGKLSKLKQLDIEGQIKADFEVDNIFAAIQKIQSFNGGSPELASIPYQTVFDPKVLELLQDPDVLANITEYTEKYNQLFEESVLFRKGIFNPTRASSVATTLKKENFFEASHKVILNGQKKEIDASEELEKQFEEEKEKILGNGNLQTISKKIIGGVAAVKSFQELLEQFPELATLLVNIPDLRKIIWHSYYLSENSSFDTLLKLYETNKERLIEIEKEALIEQTLWFKAHRDFKERFHVPFSMEIENQKDAILGTTKPTVTFTFTNDEGKPVSFNRGQLDSIDVLSLGERRALYLLYIIFDFLSIIESGNPTLIVIDDIADSFDYRNKYAIIEYLKELSLVPTIRMIVLTHNFDFYRTFQSRVLNESNKREVCFIAQKAEGWVKLLKGGSRDITNPFELWRGTFHKDPAIFIAMIPFVRNLIEYKDGNCKEYDDLTALLHIKKTTKDYTLKDLDALVKKVVSGEELDKEFVHTDKVIDLIYKVADQIVEKPIEDEISLENKIVLSIASRLAAEEYMWGYVKDKTEIKGAQTGKLFERWATENPPTNEDMQKIRATLGQVLLMTPENIHLNSFMYEPLVDVSLLHLIKLYTETKALNDAKVVKADGSV